MCHDFNSCMFNVIFVFYRAKAVRSVSTWTKIAFVALVVAIIAGGGIAVGIYFGSSGKPVALVQIQAFDFSYPFSLNISIHMRIDLNLIGSIFDDCRKKNETLDSTSNHDENRSRSPYETFSFKTVMKVTHSKW